MKNYNFISKVKYLIFSIVLLSCGNGNMNSMNSKEENISVNTNTDEEFPHNEMIDNTENFKGKTLKSVFTYNLDGTTDIKDGLKDLMNQSINGLNIKCYSYGLGKGSNKLDIVFFIPKDMKVPNVHYLDRVIVEFICEEGNLNIGNRVISITRKD